MILVPAIDIRDGRAVRLEQGSFDRETVYVEDPLEAARSFAKEGASFLHVVDLDGAREGDPANLHHLERIAGELEVGVQFGGGLRSRESIGAALTAGAERVVLGTAAYRDRELLERAVADWGERVAVAVDVREGQVSVAGWTETTGAAPEGVIEGLEARGVRRLVYTSVDRDGMLEGPDLEGATRASAALSAGSFLYSGGVGSLEHLRALRDLGLPNLEGVISGKALYERRFAVAEAAGALA